MVRDAVEPESRSSATPARGVRAVFRLLRPGDWIKNIFVFVPIVFFLASQGKDTPSAEIVREITVVSIAFIAFCFMSSGYYCVNDALDFAEDRTHPVKRRRPVASGAISPRNALVLGVALIVIALGLAMTVNRSLLVVLLLYALLQVFYNLRLKRVPFLDVATIALGFCLRAVAGAVAIPVGISVWLLLCVFFLTLYLGFIKRLCDLASVDNARRSGVSVTWKPRAGYESRDELNWLLALAGVMTVLMYLMYALSDHARRLFGERAAGFALLSPLVIVVIHRFYRRANYGLSDSPLDVITQDRTVLVAVLLFVLGTVATLFVPQVSELLRSLLYF